MNHPRTDHLSSSIEIKMHYLGLASYIEIDFTFYLYVGHVPDKESGKMCFFSFRL